jgi:phage terminase large subunit
LPDLPFSLTTKWHGHPRASYYHLCPKDYAANIKFRRKLLERATGDKAAQLDLWRMCARDPLFFVNSFCWTYDPRLTPQPTRVPFITWPFQDDALMEMFEAVGRKNLRITKSRDMGVSWMTLLVYFHCWLFKPGQSFLLGSRKEEFVDKSGDPKTLFWKLDFLYDTLPAWMKPQRLRNKLSFHNHENGSTIDGESTNTDFGRGDRRTSIMLDEFAAVENQRQVLAAVYDATNSAFAVSTHQGTATEFYNLKWETIELHWTLHPHKAAGLYRVGDDGKVDLIDTEYWQQRLKPDGQVAAA